VIEVVGGTHNDTFPHRGGAHLLVECTFEHELGHVVERMRCGAYREGNLVLLEGGGSQ
jgi:hypothetical protein